MIARKSEKLVRLGIKFRKKIDFKNLPYPKIAELLVGAFRRCAAFMRTIYKATRRSPHPHFLQFSLGISL